MKLYIKQKVFSWKDKFNIYDASGNAVYYAESEIFTIYKKLHIYDMNQKEVAYIEQENLFFLPKYFVYVDGKKIAEVKLEFTLFKPMYTVYGPEWTVKGSFWEHDYEVTDSNGKRVAGISKEWLTWGDTYELDIENGVDDKAALAVLLCIDAVVASQRAAAAT